MISIRRTVAAAVVAVMLAGSCGTAFAGTFNVNRSGSMVEDAPVSSTAPSVTGAQGAGLTIVRVTAASGGFNWGDAGIGAAGGIAIVALLVGAGLTLTQHRQGGGIRHA